MSRNQHPCTVYDFAVEGRGDFPFDMLRYDACWPLDDVEKFSFPRHSGTDAQREFIRNARIIKMRSHQYPTEGRWLSFGWSIVNGEVK